MSKKNVINTVVVRSSSAIQAVCDVLTNAKTKMITVDFRTQDGIDRTINGMLLPTPSRLTKEGKFLVKENIIERNSAGQCKTKQTQFRFVNLTTVSRIAFNKVVYNFV